MQPSVSPTQAESSQFRIKSIRGVDVEMDSADPLAQVAKKLEEKYPGHLILIQAGPFLHCFDRSAYALHVLKKYKLKLIGTINEPHLRAGFPVGNYKRRLWPVVDEFGIPYVVALGTQQEGHTLYIGESANSNAGVLATVSDEIVHQVIADLRMHGQLNKAGVQKMLANPDTSAFQLRTQAESLDHVMMQDILKASRDVRATWGENVRQCMARIMRNIYLYGQDDNKLHLLKQISADVDLLKHYLVQAQQLSQIRCAFEHRAGLAVELGRLVGGLIRSHRGQS